MTEETSIESSPTCLRPTTFLHLSQFCERFTYFGISVILPLYLRDVLHFNDDSSTTIYHLFVVVSFLTPILGGILADSYLGKFKTILYFSILYVVGTILLTLTATTPLKVPVGLGASVSLILIAVGSGAIKPVISAYGGDQFKIPEEEKRRESFFSNLFSFVCAGITLTMVVTPILRDVPCFNERTCYSAGFALPAFFMLISTVLFAAGKTKYTNLPLEENIVKKAMKCISHAMCEKLKASSKDKDLKDHWLDHAENKYDQQLIQDTKAVLKILVLYLPLPIYWALFDQQTSRWTFQASKMDGSIFGGWYVIKPDQFQVVNALLTLIFIPICDKILYPLMAKLGLLKKPLQRLTTGCFLASIPFVICGVVELKIQEYEASGTEKLHMAWLLPQYIAISLSQVILSVTLSEFSYSQAPASMKSFLQAVWLITSGLGNLIVIFIAEVKFFESQANEFFLFSGLNVVNSIFFILLAINYEPGLQVDKTQELRDSSETVTRKSDINDSIV